MNNFISFYCLNEAYIHMLYTHTLDSGTMSHHKMIVPPGKDIQLHRNRNVVILMKFPSLTAPKVVKMTTFGAVSD